MVEYFGIWISPSEFWKPEIPVPNLKQLNYVSAWRRLLWLVKIREHKYFHDFEREDFISKAETIQS
jgi:MoaA/NifB/PqqE/SkfB family radical SAM enzyme